MPGHMIILGEKPLLVAASTESFERIEKNIGVLIRSF